ncbi:LuxR C-terminal-related transcriptional regulator [Streptomyces flaveolus]|uniref:LuxR C-terminal-related transcriptional regulator n=1 Tax=Streptomyces flaveolus TaxID=67297 RepID=UPI0037FB3334
MSRLSDADLLVRAAGSLRSGEITLVFGGFGDTRVPVSVCAGGTTSAITSMVIRPRRGLGGRVLAERRPMAVRHYEHDPGITHDYDGPVLGEGVVGLAAAPLMRGDRICGLLYAATRRPAALTSATVGRLVTAADSISLRISPREDLERHPYTLPAHHAERIREIARSTRDAETRAALLSLLGPSAVEPGVDEPLTPRQRQVLLLAERGLRNAEIAVRLGLTEQTVKTYMRTLMARLGARTRQEAVHTYRHRAAD